MTSPRLTLSVRRALAIHAISTVLIAAAVAVASAAISAAIAVDAARTNAASVADTVAHAVAAPLTLTDVGAGGEESRAAVLEELQPFIDAELVDRVKIWHIDGDDAVVLFSDERRNEGVHRPFDPVLAERLDRGEVVVFEVPDDAEHEFEFGKPCLLEAFIGFEDARGLPLRLELYLPSSAAETRASLLAALLPLAVLGPLALGAATLPLALRLARRLQRQEEERRELLKTALAASDRERLRLATRLHDGVIQDLAGVGLTLQALDRASAADASGGASLARLGDLVDAEIEELRAILTELAPPEYDGSLGQALRDLAAEMQADAVRVELELDNLTETNAETSALVYRVARELMRNAIAHAEPSVVRVRLRDGNGGLLLDVSDDGRGFDPDAPARDGHLGLRLLHQAVSDSGGSIAVDTTAEGTRVTVSIPGRSA